MKHFEHPTCANHLSLRNAILRQIAQDDECPLDDLLALEEHHDGSAAEEVIALIIDGLAYIAVPLSQMDWDTCVMRIDWLVGSSTVADIEAQFGPAHADKVANGARVLAYDLYVENIDDEKYAPPPAPYAARDEAESDRPTGCAFPYASIWPPEALQVEFTFAAKGTLHRFDFKVANRLT
ncbi:hypothetical protein ACFQRC_04365 [Enterovirga sp. GCM10030262]|uniref:hypothetical protein n=1 Tax=Enterovirga sp. GCM10030262 TaxID=3273391 RepID=UPI00360D1837